MQLSRLFYTWVLTGAWILCTILTLWFPAAEGMSLLFVFLAGIWLQLLGNHSPAEVPAAVASVVTVLLLALAMDYVGVRRRTWLRLMAGCAGLLAGMVAFFYVKEALRESSFSGANGKFNFDRPTAVAGYLLFCAGGGLLVGSLGSIGGTCIRRWFQQWKPRSRSQAIV